MMPSASMNDSEPSTMPAIAAADVLLLCEFDLFAKPT